MQGKVKNTLYAVYIPEYRIVHQLVLVVLQEYRIVHLLVLVVLQEYRIVHQLVLVVLQAHLQAVPGDHQGSVLLLLEHVQLLVRLRP